MTLVFHIWKVYISIKKGMGKVKGDQNQRSHFSFTQLTMKEKDSDFKNFLQKRTLTKPFDNILPYKNEYFGHSSLIFQSDVKNECDLFLKKNFPGSIFTKTFCCIVGHTTWQPESQKYQRHCVSKHKKSLQDLGQ